MSFLRHLEIYPSDGGAGVAANAPAHRLDEFPAGYSSAGWSPPEPTSASPAEYDCAVKSSCRSRSFHRTANCVLTVCVSRGGKLNPVLWPPKRLSLIRALPRRFNRFIRVRATCLSCSRVSFLISSVRLPSNSPRSILLRNSSVELHRLLGSDTSRLVPTNGKECPMRSFGMAVR